MVPRLRSGRPSQSGLQFEGSGRLQFQPVQAMQFAGYHQGGFMGGPGTGGPVQSFRLVGGAGIPPGWVVGAARPLPNRSDPESIVRSWYATQLSTRARPQAPHSFSRP